jgi:sarcosine oxidase subunit alpha
VNTFGGLAGDRARWLDKLGAFMPVGFYYKAFNSKRWFPKWERLFRVLTGLGVLDLNAPRIKTPKRYAFADVLVVGAGPSGLSAALEAAESGADVMLVDENALPGGSGAFALGVGSTQRAQFEALLSRVQSHPRIRVVAHSVAAGYYADHWVPVVEPGRITKVRARSVVVAAGAFEQPAVFRNNDLPGVMLASGALRLLHRHAVVPCRRAVVFAANSDAYQAALDLHAHGVHIEAIIDLRAHGEASHFSNEVAKVGIQVRTGWAISEAMAGKDGRVAAVSVAPLLDAANRNDAPPAGLRLALELALDRSETLPCDGVLMSVGWAPALALAYQAGMKVSFDEGTQQFVPAELPECVFVCGRANGIYDFEARLADGKRAGHAAVHSLGMQLIPPPARAMETQQPSHPYPIIAHPKARNFIDFDEDLQLKDFYNAAQEGFDNIELLKRFSTVGMGPSQGKHSNMNAIRVLARIRGLGIAQVGSTTSRPMFHPVPMSLLAGRGVSLTRRTPVHERHRALGAHFMHAGAWERPEYYARSGMSREQAIQAEVLHVRNAVGVIDVGTLGKIDVIGPDAAEFLERVYTDRFSRMKHGAIRYGLMLDETGVVIDDGIVARLASDHYYFTTTTTGSAVVYRELQRRQAMWGLRISLVNLTGQLTAFNLAGPDARKVLARITPTAIDGESFPFMAMREAVVAGVPTRLLRIGFVGELGYEIHAHADQGAALWDALFKAGADFNIRPFGVEAQRVLRLEKGHPIVGQDTDGVTNPLEAGLGWALKEEKPFYIGQRSLEVLRKSPLRQTLVGFQLRGEASQRPRECHLAIHEGEIAGRVTSIAWSPTLSRIIGLALVTPTLKAHGNFSIRVDDGSMCKPMSCACPSTIRNMLASILAITTCSIKRLLRMQRQPCAMSQRGQRAS